MRIDKNSLRTKIRSNKVLVQNFSYLSALQIFNLLIPLITYPYLIRVVGKETYGLVVFAQAIIGYLIILTDFGFNISATREVSVHRDNKEKLSEIVSSVFIVKMILMFLAFIVLSICLIIIPQTRGHEVLFLLSMWAVVYSVIFPAWYFQGVEQMKFITYITLVSRLIFLALIFVFIHCPNDYLYIPIINGVGAIIAALVSLYVVFKLHHITFRWQPIQTLKYYMKDSVPIFLSNVSIQLYVNTNKVIVGTFLGMTEVAYYDLAEKITTILKMPQSIFSQAIFPKISRERDNVFIKKVLKITSMMNITFFVMVLILGKYVILLLGGEQMLPAEIVLNLLALTVPIIGMSNILGINMLIPFGFNTIFSRVIIISGIFYGIIMIIVGLLFHFTLINIAITTVLAEVFVTTYLNYYCKKLGLWEKKNTIM